MRGTNEFYLGSFWFPVCSIAACKLGLDSLHNFEYQIVALNEALLTNSMSLSQESEDELLAVSSIFFDISVLEPPKSILVTPNNDIQVRFILSNDYPEK